MSEQGSSLHFRKLSIAQTKKKLATLEGSCAILASNRRWTSFVPLDQASLDVARVSQLLAVTVLQVWFDEDSAVVLQIFAPDGWQAELTVPLDGTYEFGPEDERFFHGMAERKRLPSALIKELTRKMRQSQGRDSWLRSHGLEETLGLPFVIPLPVPCTEELLREIVPDAEVVRGVKKGTGKSVLPTLPQGPVARRTGSSSERAIVDLHFHYLMNLWSMNDWKVYYRYKKHLPAERRGEVDNLVNMMMTGATDEEVRQALERILATSWDADDWDALIRDPNLLRYEPLGQEQLQDWQRRLDETPSGGTHGS